MDFVVKVSNDYGDAITQFINPYNLSWSSELFGSGQLNFSVPTTSKEAKFVKRYKKIELFSIKAPKDISLWTGFVLNVIETKNFITFECFDERQFMKSRLLQDLKTWYNTPISEALEFMINESNGVTGGIGGLLSYETNTSDVVAAEISGQEQFFNILDGMATRIKGAWQVKRNRIILNENYGRDLTTGSNKKTVVWNVESPVENNILDFRLVFYGSEIVTRLHSKQPNRPVQIIEGSYSDFGVVEQSRAFNENDDQQLIQSYLDQNSQDDFSVEIEVLDGFFQPGELLVGDKISLEIKTNTRTVNSVMNVLSISTSVENKSPIVRISLSSNQKRVPNGQKVIEDLNKRLKQLELLQN